MLFPISNYSGKPPEWTAALPEVKEETPKEETAAEAPKEEEKKE